MCSMHVCEMYRNVNICYKKIFNTKLQKYETNSLNVNAGKWCLIKKVVVQEFDRIAELATITGVK